jgi:hypothetical protein
MGAAYCSFKRIMGSLLETMTGMVKPSTMLKLLREGFNSLDDTDVQGW